MRARFRQAANKVWQALLAVSNSVWLFLGRLGLAFRNLLTWLIWKPLFYLTMPFWLPLRWLLWDTLAAIVPPTWHFVGRMGLALRHLLTAYLWRGIRNFVIRPFLWLYRRVIKAFTLWLLRTIWLGICWLGAHIRRFGRFVWDKTAPQRAVYGRRVSSRWRLLKANLRVTFRRPKAPAAALVAPKRPRENLRAVRTFRLATAVAAVALLAVVGLLSTREPRSTAVADDRPFETATPQIIVLTPTPVPPTPTVIPTVSVKLTPWATPNPLDGGGSNFYPAC